MLGERFRKLRRRLSRRVEICAKRLHNECMNLPQAREQFGKELAFFRKSVGLTQAALGSRVGISGSLVSGLERGTRTPSLTLIPRLDEVLGTRGDLETLWRTLTGNGRPVWLEEIRATIHRASAVYAFQPLTFPWYLQTEPYAAAIIAHGAPWLPSERVAEIARERAEQARAVTSSTSPRIWLALDSAVLARRYGGTSVTRGQLRHVLALAESGRVTLQILPCNAAQYPGTSGPFTLVTADKSPEVLYAESAWEGQTVTDPRAVARYRMLYASIQSLSRGVAESLEQLREALERITE